MDIVWDFRFPQRPDQLLEPPSRDENYYHVSNKPRPYDPDHARSDQDGLVRIRERFKSINQTLTLPGNYFDFLYNIVHYDENLPIHLGGHLCDVLKTITESLLNLLESAPSEDWASVTARQYRTVIGMIFYLLSRQLRNLVTQLDENGIRMDKDKKSKTIQRVTQHTTSTRGGGGGASTTTTTASNANNSIQWGKDLQIKLQKQLDSVFTSLFFLFKSSACKQQYENEILDQDIVVATMPYLIKPLTSQYIRSIFTHPTLPRSFNNLFITLVQQYCSPQMVAIGGIGDRMKKLVITGLVEMIKNDVYDYKFILQTITLSFAKFNSTYLFGFLFEAILDLPQSDKTTLSELPKTLKSLGSQLPSRVLSQINPLFETLQLSQSYSIRNSIVELITALVTNAFVLPPDYHPGTGHSREVIYYKPHEYSMISSKPGSNVNSPAANTDDHAQDGDDDDGDDDDEEEEEDGDDNNKSREKASYDDDDDDYDNTAVAKSENSNRNKTSSTKNKKRKQRYSVGFDDQDEENFEQNDQDNNNNTNTFDYSKLQTEGPLGTAAALREHLVGLIIQRLDDVHSEGRTRAVQCTGTILLATTLSFDLQLKCLSAIYNATRDKSSKVRKFALMLNRAIIQRAIHPDYLFSTSHTLHLPTVEANRIAFYEQTERAKTDLVTIKDQMTTIIAQIETIKRNAMTTDEAVLEANPQYIQCSNQINKLQSKFDQITVVYNQSRAQTRACVAEIHMIQQIQTLLRERCVLLLKSPTLTDTEESIACILYAFAAHMDDITSYISALLNECGANPIIINYAAQIWGEILLKQHEAPDSNGQIFFSLIRTVLHLEENAKIGLYKIFNSLASKNNIGSLSPGGHGSAGNALSIFVRDIIPMNPINNNDQQQQQPSHTAGGITFYPTDDKPLTQTQINQLQQRYTSMLSFLLFTGLEYLTNTYTTNDMVLLDVSAIFSLVRALIGTSTPIGPNLFHIFWKFLTSQHNHPYLNTQILDMLYSGVLIISSAEMKQLVTYCVNNVIYSQQCVATPVVDSIIQYETKKLTDPNQDPVPVKKKSDKRAQKGKKSSKKGSRRHDDDDDDDDDFDIPTDDDGDDDANNNVNSTTTSQTVIVTSQMVTSGIRTQSQNLLYWTSLAEVCIKLIAKLTKNPIPIFEHILQHLSIVLYELDDQSHFNWLAHNAPSYIPSICKVLHSMSLNSIQELQADDQSQAHPILDVSLSIPTQCHCHSTILIKASETKSLVLPVNCTIFDAKSKLAISVISPQERLTRLFTVTGFITMHCLLIIEENESKIRALTKKEVDANLHRIGMLTQNSSSPSTNNVGGAGNDDDDDDEMPTKNGPVKRKAINSGVRGKNKKARASYDDDDDDSNDEMSDDSDGENDGVSTRKKPLLKKRATKQTAKKGQGAANATSAEQAEDEEERAGMLSRAEQHIEENVRFIERTLREPNHFFGMIYQLINHVCIARRQFQPSVFFAALSTRSRLMLISKDVCRDAIPGMLSLLRDIQANSRTLDPEYVITVKEIIALAISDGAQRFPNECAPALDHLNTLATDKNEQVGIYALHALASVLLTGMHKPNKALPHICTCLASEYPRIVTIARALVQTLGSKRDGNISLIAIAFPDILSRFVEGITARNKSSSENPLKVSKELLLYVKTETEISKVVKSVTTRLSTQLKMNNIESSNDGTGTNLFRFDQNGKQIIETSTKMVLGKVNKISTKFDRYRFSLGYYRLVGTKRQAKRSNGISKANQNRLHDISYPIIAHQDLKSTVVNTTLVPAPSNEYCTCNLIKCMCSPVFKVKFDFITGDEHNLIQLERIEKLEDEFIIQYTSDSAKMTMLKNNAAAQQNTSKSNQQLDTTYKQPTPQDYFERARFLIVVLRSIKFNLSTARKFCNDFNDYSQACHHPQLYNELKHLGRHIKSCVLRKPTGLQAANAANQNTDSSTKTAIEIDLADWESKVDKEYDRYNKSNNSAFNDGDDNNNDEDNGNQKRHRLDGDDDDDDEIDNEDESKTNTSGRRTSGRRVQQLDDEDEDNVKLSRRRAPPAKKAAAKKNDKKPVGRNTRRRHQSEEEEEEESSEESDSGSDSNQDDDDDDEQEEEEEVKPKRRTSGKAQTNKVTIAKQPVRKATKGKGGRR